MKKLLKSILVLWAIKLDQEDIFLPIPKQNKWFKQGDDSFLGAYINYASTPDFEYGSDLEMDMAKLHLQMAIRNRSWIIWFLMKTKQIGTFMKWSLTRNIGGGYENMRLNFVILLSILIMDLLLLFLFLKRYSPFPQLIQSSKDDDPFPSL